MKSSKTKSSVIKRSLTRKMKHENRWESEYSKLNSLLLFPQEFVFLILVDRVFKNEKFGKKTAENENVKITDFYL